ncbi:hypothetical protein NMY22_g13274 [Coprinellus aureogranulatus]|nr:hypothetical protein NMY22_g13274 [Coprinellus aureogranulatus]
MTIGPPNAKLKGRLSDLRVTSASRSAPARVTYVHGQLSISSQHGHQPARRSPQRQDKLRALSLHPPPSPLSDLGLTQGLEKMTEERAKKGLGSNSGVAVDTLVAPPTRLCLSLKAPATYSALTTSYAQQTRTAVTKAAPAQKQAQSIGGVKKGRKEKWEKKIAQERAHRVRDVPKFTRYPQSKLQIPKTKDRPAVLPEPFQPGSGHALDLPPFGRSNLTPKHIGEATLFPNSPTNASKVFGLPNKMFPGYCILSSPTSITRPTTLTSSLASLKAPLRPVGTRVWFCTGVQAQGNALRQAVQYAQAEGWVVVYVPRAVALVNSTNSYIYDIRTQTYLQPNASYRLLNHIHAANASLLSKIPLKHSFVSEKLTVEAGGGKTLADLAQAALKDKSQQSAPLVLDALLKELEEQKDVPVLVAVDDFQSLFHDSAYRDPFFQPIKPHHLSLPRTLLEYSSGSRVLSNGAFLGAVTESDTTYTVPVELEDAVGMTGGREGEEDGENKYDELFMSKYVESDGNPRDFVWKGLLATMAP